MADTTTDTPAALAPIPAKEVLYCAVCSYPPEYCEFGSHLTRCKEWLESTHPDLFVKYWSDEALESRLGTLSLDKQQKLEKDMAKAEAKAEAKADAALKKKMASQVTIKRIQRNKNKYVTAIHGLEAFDVDLKKAAKLFAQKFATGSSVTKNAQGFDEIVVQGDVAYDLEEILVSPKGKDLPILKGIPGDNIDIVEDKKKKKAEE